MATVRAVVGRTGPGAEAPATKAEPRVRTERVECEVKARIEVTEADSVEVDAQPGRLLAITMRRRTVTENVPAPFYVEADTIGRLTQPRAVAVEGLYLRGANVLACDGSTSAEFFSNVRGAPPSGGHQLTAEQVVAALTDGVFSAAEVARFAEHPVARAVVQRGVLATVTACGAGQPPAFLGKLAASGLAPGFTAGLGIEGLAEYLELALKRATIAEVLGLPAQVKALA